MSRGAAAAGGSRGGGGGGGRGGRGRGGKPGVFTPQLIGHLNYQDIIAQSKDGTGILYPPTDVPNTDYPSEVESKIAARYNIMTAEMKYTPYWLDAPVKSSSKIEKYSDKFKAVRATTTGAPTPAFARLHKDRGLDKELLPTTDFEAIYERKKRVKTADGAARKRVKTAKDLADVADVEDAEENSDEEPEEELEEVDDEEWEDDNDYADNYFDNGEDDGGDGDALGGGGDEDGGVFD
ncbi:hypothetical protein T439DRAFT_322461 [Meredithblackwellia eburnea MCA 4105]